MHEPPDDNRQSQDQPALKRQSEDLARSEIAERLVAEGLQIAVGQHLGDPPPRDEQDQCGNDRLHIQKADERAVEDPATERHHQRHGDSCRQAEDRIGLSEFGGEDQRSQGPGQGHDSADAEVDAARGDHQRHADGDDRNRRHLTDVDEEGLQTDEVRRDHNVEQQDQCQGDQAAMLPDEIGARRVCSRRARERKLGSAHAASS